MKIESHHSHIEEHKKDRNAQMVNNNNNNNNNDIVIDNDKNYKKKLKEELLKELQGNSPPSDPSLPSTILIFPYLFFNGFFFCFDFRQEKILF